MIILAISVIVAYFIYKIKPSLSRKKDGENKIMRYIFNIFLLCFFGAVAYAVIVFLYLIYKYMEYKGLAQPSFYDLFIWFWNNY